MQQQQYQNYLLNELIKTYHVFCKFDKPKAAQILAKINEYRLQIAVLAEQREIFIDKIIVPANASGYKNDVFFSRDDLDSLVIRMIADFAQDTTVTLVQQGTREQLFTRQAVAWQHLFSMVQAGTNLGQKIPFDFPQEIYLEKSQALDIGIIDQTTEGYLFVHGCNLLDDAAPNRAALLAEIQAINEMTGMPLLPETQLVPIQFEFTGNNDDDPAVAVDGGDEIYSIKSDRSVILTEVSLDATDARYTLIDKGRNQTICTDVDGYGIAGRAFNQYSVFYPLPYPHLLRAQDRIQLKGLNGSPITTSQEDADTKFTMCFRGYTV